MSSLFDSDETRPEAEPKPRDGSLARVLLGVVGFSALAAVLLLRIAGDGVFSSFNRAARPPIEERLKSDPLMSATNERFDLSKCLVPKDEIRPGGPPKDGIPSLTNPRFIRPEEAEYITFDSRLVGFELDGDARAYPLAVLNWHEAVNDVVAERPVLISYCPLCDSVAAFDRETSQGVKEFGISGVLYNSNVLMYDRGGKPEGLWSQMAGKCISGPLAGENLKPLKAELTTWRDWRKRYPRTKVLSTQTDAARPYTNDPYAEYFAHPGLMFPVNPKSDRLGEKDRVFGAALPGGKSKAFPLALFRELTEPFEFRDELAGKSFVLKYDPPSQSLRVVESDDAIRWVHSLWFAWFAFHPETEIASAPKGLDASIRKP